MRISDYEDGSRPTSQILMSSTPASLSSESTNLDTLVIVLIEWFKYTEAVEDGWTALMCVDILKPHSHYRMLDLLQSGATHFAIIFSRRTPSHDFTKEHYGYQIIYFEIEILVVLTYISSCSLSIQLYSRYYFIFCQAKALTCY
jgi:hypothetical protein